MKYTGELKDLEEKFGFKKSTTAWLPRYSRNYIEIYFDLPEKWLNDKTDQYRINKKLPLIHNRSILIDDDVPEHYRESLLYDLIQAGLIEKVEVQL